MILNLCFAGYVILSVKLSCPCEFSPANKLENKAVSFQLCFHVFYQLFFGTWIGTAKNIWLVLGFHGHCGRDGNG